MFVDCHGYWQFGNLKFKTVSCILSAMKKTILIFGSMCVAMLLLFALQQWSLFALGGSENLGPVISGSLFLILGIFTSRYFYLKSEVRKQALRQSSLSERELRVLHLISDGLSNREIADQLCIAETTVKSHVSKILSKLDAKRRTEAVKIGRDLKII